MFEKIKNRNMTKKDWAVNLVLYIIGVFLMPFGVVLTINSHVGAGGYDALNFAIGDRLGISTSLAIYLTAIIAVILTAVIRRGFPRITTFISSFFLGLSTDFWKKMLGGIEGTGGMYSVVIFLVGLIFIAFAVASYVLSVFPTNPTDDLVVAVTEKGVRIGIAKIGFDAVCVVLAFIMGGEIGFGTIVCTFALGPVVDLFYGILKKITVRYNIVTE